MTINKEDPNSIKLAAQYLKEGKIVILPTDTVYGFSGIVDKDSDFKSDQKIREIKGRAENKPLIQLIADAEDIKLYTKDKIPEKLLNKWPGSLTIIVHTKDDAPLAPHAKLPTIAFRCPGDQWLRQIIKECGSPIYSTSVNRSGQKVLDTALEIQKEFSEEVDLIITDGDKKGALPSTLVSLEGQEIKVLRQGSVKIE
ncbi:MAG: threonylcarbamoyl-AMP synthase [Treponema sp.]|nr:threonylcarbamoyl-AMP synthase [Treponema sp.]